MFQFILLRLLTLLHYLNGDFTLFSILSHANCNTPRKKIDSIFCIIHNYAEFNPYYDYSPEKNCYW